MKLLKKVCDLYKRQKEVVNYLFFGGMSFLLNLFLFTVLYQRVHLPTLAANGIAWAVTVLFVYVTNRTWVFTDENKNTSRREGSEKEREERYKEESRKEGQKKSRLQETAKELFRFLTGRLLTLAMEQAVLYFCIDQLRWNATVVKIIAQVLVIVCNYVISKCFVFVRKE